MKMIEPDMDIGLPLMDKDDQRRIKNRIHAKASRQRRIDSVQALKEELQQLRAENKRLIKQIGHDILVDPPPIVPFKPRPRRTIKPSSKTPGLSLIEVHRAKNRESAERSRWKRELAAHQLKADIEREQLKQTQLLLKCHSMN
jgi:hypothetical protein